MSNAVVKFNDGLASLYGALGDPMRDKSAGVYYGVPMLSDQQIISMYRGSWLPRKIVNIPAFDSVRRWRDWQAEMKDITLIEAEEQRLMLQQKVLEAKIKARLWGGSAIYIGTADTDLMKPLEIERIGKGGIRYLTVMSRLELTAGEIERDPINEFYGKPKHYTVNSTNIHPSRFAVFVGAAHPEERYNQWGPGQGWGDTVLLAPLDAIKNADSVPANVASLVFEANVDVFGVPDFMDQMTDPAYENRMLQRFGLVAVNKGINRSILRDANETFERKTISFAGLPEIFDKVMQIVSGAADIPATRLYGMSPAGMSATGESDLRNYYDALSSMQNLETRPTLYNLDECLIRSTFGVRPDDVHYIWSSLWQISDKERVEIGKAGADIIEKLNNTGLYNPAALSKVGATFYVEHSVFPGLEEAIEEEPPVDFDALLNPEPLAVPEPSDMFGPVKDMAPRPVYVSRNVKNAAAIVKWAKAAGFETTLPAADLHVTIAYSRSDVDWDTVGESWSSELKIAAGGPRQMTRFGEAVVMEFSAMELRWRHNTIMEAGGSSDHPKYQPHITITWNAPDLDLSTIEPYQGEIVLGPEIWKPIDDEWKNKLNER